MWTMCLPPCPVATQCQCQTSCHESQTSCHSNTIIMQNSTARADMPSKQLVCSHTSPGSTRQQGPCHRAIRQHQAPQQGQVVGTRPVRDVDGPAADGTCHGMQVGGWVVALEHVPAANSCRRQTPAQYVQSLWHWLQNVCHESRACSRAVFWPADMDSTGERSTAVCSQRCSCILCIDFCHEHARDN